jgi:hypothetical protein
VTRRVGLRPAPARCFCRTSRAFQDSVRLPEHAREEAIVDPGDSRHSDDHVLFVVARTRDKAPNIRPLVRRLELALIGSRLGPVHRRRLGHRDREAVRRLPARRSCQADRRVDRIVADLDDRTNMAPGNPGRSPLFLSKHFGE